MNRTIYTVNSGEEGAEKEVYCGFDSLVASDVAKAYASALKRRVIHGSLPVVTYRNGIEISRVSS